MQQLDWIPNVVVLVVVLLIGWFFVTAMRKARARRRAEFEETPGERQAVGEAEDEALAKEALGTEVEAVEPEAAEVEAEAPAAPVEEKAAAEPEVAHVPDEAIARGLERTHTSLMGRVARLFRAAEKVDAKVLDELEDALLLADVGVAIATRIVGKLRESLAAGKIESADAARLAVQQELRRALEKGAQSGEPLVLGTQKPHVILFVGVNGVGKTTTIGKIAARLRDEGRDVVLAAGDTFRAAAVEQLGIWGERTGSRVIKGADGADPASVVFNALEHARSSGADVLLADTAGRLHTKKELMDELHKVKRALGKARDGAPDETWLVVDATTGQNALQQAREFHAQLGLTGIILTKLDGTAKGGVVIAIADAVGVPVRFVGVGEKAEDLRPFVAADFVAALFAAA